MLTHWLEETYEKYKQDLFRFLFVLLKDEQAAEDALQETFYKAFLHQKTYVHLEKEKAWLYQIARNTAYDMMRKRKRELPTEQEQIDAAIEAGAKKRYERALNKLKEQYKEAVEHE